MPEIGGAYLLTLDVPNGDNTTSASVAVLAPDGTSPAVTADGATTAWQAIVSPLDMAGWWLATWTVTGKGQGVKSSRFYVSPTPAPFGVWPPSLADLKLDMGQQDDQDDGKDSSLQMDLAAAIERVRLLKGHAFNLGEEESDDDLPAPDVDIILGTLRLAARWEARRTTWDNVAQFGAAGGAITPVPAYDSDIERLLRIGRYGAPEEQFA